MDHLNQPILCHTDPTPPDNYTIEDAIDMLLSRLDAVESFLLQKIGEQIKELGEMSQTSINLIVAMNRMGTNIAEITRRLQAVTQINNITRRQILQRALDDMYTDPRFERALDERDISPETKAHIETFTRAVATQTQGQMANIANTTAVSQAYKDALDPAIIAVSTGMDSYTSQLHKLVSDAGSAGMPIVYESGFRRRLDSAARQNITDAVNQVAQNAAEAIGEDLGFDAVEISAHLMSAPDHEPIQGRVFLKAEYEKMQNGLPFSDVDGHNYTGFKRPIGEWNCRHFDAPFDTRSSIRAYTEEELKDFRDRNHKGCTINGKKMTIYEASQLMRRTETDIRRQKDIAIVAAHAGDTDTQAACQRKINALDAYYSEICQRAGLRPQRNRTVVPGFTPYK